MSSINSSNSRASVSKTVTTLEVLTLQELATYLGVSKSTVYRCVQLSRVPAFRVGRQWRVNLKLVQNHLIDSYERKTGLQDKVPLSPDDLDAILNSSK